MEATVVLRYGALIDAGDLPLVAGVTLTRYPSGHIYFKRRGVRYALHRVLMNAGPDECVDHINGNPLDNRRANLRLCTHSQNMQNRRRHSNNSTGFKGVWFDPRRGRFRAQISAFNRKFHLGSYATAEEAAAVYAAKAAELHGAFCRTSS